MQPLFSTNCSTYSNSNPNQINSETISKAISLLPVKNSETLYTIQHNVRLGKLRRLFNKLGKVERNSINFIYGVPILKNRYLPKNGVAFLNKDGKILKSFILV